MLIDIFVAYSGGIISRSLGVSENSAILIAIGLILLFFINWLRGVIRLAKNENKTGMWVSLLLGLFLSFLIGWIVSSFFKSELKEIERETFYCSSCHINCSKELLGGETEYWGKICRYCLEKKHREKDKELN